MVVVREGSTGYLCRFLPCSIKDEAAVAPASQAARLKENAAVPPRPSIVLVFVFFAKKQFLLQSRPSFAVASLF